jgi:riboflavin transporter FmnP
MEAGIRKIVGGLVGGSLGAAVGIGLYGLVAGMLTEATFNASFVLAGVLIGTGYGVLAGQVFNAIPGGFAGRAAVFFGIAFVGELAVGTVDSIPALLVSFVAYAVVLTFVLNQTIALPLPFWRPLRRAEEFKDIRAELH